MKKLTLFLALPLFMACTTNTPDHELCDCVAAGAEADSISAYYLEHEQTIEGKEALDKAIQKRDELCAPFHLMLATELQEKAADCNSLKFDAEKE